MNEDTRDRPVETSLFWLSLRYYSPELCRFISPDDVDYLDPTSINGLNLYCYCMNNPVNYIQSSVYYNDLFSKLSIFSILSVSYGLSKVDWEKGGLQIPIWISTLMSNLDFESSIAPALHTLYQYIRYPGVKDLNKLYGLDYVPGKLNTICRRIGYGLLLLNIGLSAWTNFTSDNLTTKQQCISFSGHCLYIRHICNWTCC